MQLEQMVKYLCQVKEDGEKRLCILWFHSLENLEKAKYNEGKNSECLVFGLGIEEKIARNGQWRNFWGAILSRLGWWLHNDINLSWIIDLHNDKG